MQGFTIKRLTQVHPLLQVFRVANNVGSLCHNSCTISCFEISGDFGVRTMTRENQSLNESYLRSKFDWDSAELSDCNNSITLNLTTVAKC